MACCMPASHVVDILPKLVHHDTKYYFPTLPERKKNNRLDGKKLQHRIIRTKQISCGLIKQKQCIQSKGHCDVVHDSNVEIATVSPEM